jgi:ketosteroid isomerase-like protein
VSERDAEIVREQWEEIARRSPMSPDDFSSFVEENWHPEIHYEEDPRWPGSSSYEGRDQVKAVFEGYRETMGNPSVTIEKVIDAGDEQVMLIRFSGTSPGDLPWDHLWAYRCRVRDGRLGYFRAYWDPEEALADAGVDSSS